MDFNGNPTSGGDENLNNGSANLDVKTIETTSVQVNGHDVVTVLGNQNLQKTLTTTQTDFQNNQDLITKLYVDEHSSGGHDPTDGSVNILGKTLSAVGFSGSSTLKTNMLNEIETVPLEIGDVVNLQTELNNKITNPYNGLIEVVDVRTQDITSLNTSMDRFKHFEAAGVNETNIVGDVVTNRLRTTSIVSSNDNIRLLFDGLDVDVVAPQGVMTVNNNEVLTTASNGVGDIVGPTISVVGHIPIFSNTTGKLLKESSVMIDNLNNMILPGDFLQANGNFIHNGFNIQLNGLGAIQLQNTGICQIQPTGLLSLKGFTLTSGVIDLGNNKIINSSPPVNDTDLATKKYVLDNSGGSNLTDLLKKTQNIDLLGTTALGTKFNDYIVQNDCTVSAGLNSVVLGSNNSAAGQHNFCFGYDNVLFGTQNIVLGRGNNSSQIASYIVGELNTTSGPKTYVIGESNTCSGVNSKTIGTHCQASAENSIAMGLNANVIHPNSFVWNSKNNVVSSTAEQQFTIGGDLKATGDARVNGTLTCPSLCTFGHTQLLSVNNMNVTGNFYNQLAAQSLVTPNIWKSLIDLNSAGFGGLTFLPNTLQLHSIYKLKCRGLISNISNDEISFRLKVNNNVIWTSDRILMKKTLTSGRYNMKFIYRLITIGPNTAIDVYGNFISSNSTVEMDNPQIYWFKNSAVQDTFNSTQTSTLGFEIIMYNPTTNITNQLGTWGKDW